MQWKIFQKKKKKTFQVGLKLRYHCQFSRQYEISRNFAWIEEISRNFVFSKIFLNSRENHQTLYVFVNIFAKITIFFQKAELCKLPPVMCSRLIHIFAKTSLKISISWKQFLSRKCAKISCIKIFSQKWSLFHMLLAFFVTLRKSKPLLILQNLLTRFSRTRKNDFRC